MSLTNKDDRKFFLDACQGLGDKDKFDGGEDKYEDFVKSMKKPFNDVRVMEVLNVAVGWDDNAVTVTGRRIVTKDVNLFELRSF